MDCANTQHSKQSPYDMAGVVMETLREKYYKAHVDKLPPVKRFDGLSLREIRDFEEKEDSHGTQAKDE